MTLVTDCHLKILVGENNTAIKRMRNAVHDKQIFLIVDESTLFDTLYLNILMESLETPQVRYLYDCQLLKFMTVNLETKTFIAQFRYENQISL